MSKISCGIDIGSRTTKIILFDIGINSIRDYEIADTTANPKKSSYALFDHILKKNNLSRHELYSIVSTGYGRDQFEFADKKLTEITCHAKGALFLYHDAKGVIDIGGQDSKAIRIENGLVADFIMNDKCAAGTGRFLEVVTNILEINQDDMERLINESTSPCSISSMCVVFAESEIISLLAIGKKPPDILTGVLESLAKRTASMAGKVNIAGKIIFTGGVARNKAMVKIMEEVLGEKLLIPPEPAITGALGAALSYPK